MKNSKKSDSNLEFGLISWTPKFPTRTRLKVLPSNSNSLIKFFSSTRNRSNLKKNWLISSLFQVTWWPIQTGLQCWKIREFSLSKESLNLCPKSNFWISWLVETSIPMLLTTFVLGWKKSLLQFWNWRKTSKNSHIALLMTSKGKCMSWALLCIKSEDTSREEPSYLSLRYENEIQLK